MTGITVVARIKAGPDSVETVKDGLLAMIEPTRKEAGCLDYQLYQDTMDPSVFVFYEKWENADSLEKHKETDHYKRYASTVFGLIEERVESRLTRIA